MLLHDRFPVDGTTPTIYIGHREYKDRRTHQKKIGAKWYAEYCYQAQRSYEPLRTSNKQAAIRAAFAIVQRLERGEERPRQRRVEFAELIKEYLEFKRNQGRTKNTLTKYKNMTQHLSDWVAQEGITFISSFTARHFWAYNHWLTAKVGEKTCFDYVMFVKQLMKWAKRHGLLHQNPLESEAPTKPQSAEQPCFTPDQVESILKAAHPHEGAIFATLAYTGMRIGEVRDLRWADVYFDLKKIHVRLGGSSNKPKDKAYRIIPLHPKLAPVLQALAKKNERIFNARPSKKYPEGGRPISERHLLVSIKSLCRRLKFADPDQYCLHSFRHAFASMLCRKNVSFKHALEIMGHADSVILDHYFKMFDRDADAAIAAVNYGNADGGEQKPSK